MTKLSRKRKYVVILPFCALLFFIGTVTVQAATYYVATTGNDANAGTAVDTPFLTIQKCIDVMVAGDTCTVANGTYTDADGNGVVGYIRPSNQNGTAANPITLKSTNPLGAKIRVSSKAGQGNHGIYIDRAYWIVEGFDISGFTSTALGTGSAAITLNGSNGSVVRNNALHDIARTVCSNSVIGNSGVYTTPAASNSTIRDNLIYSIGRLYNGENGCSTSINGNDHGIYIEGSTGLTIKRNVFYDDNRGWSIHLYNSAGLTASNINIYNNTFADKPPAGAPQTVQGQIVLATRVTNVNIKNNISYDANVGLVRCSSSIIPTNVLVDHNLSSTLIKNTECTGNVTFTNNTENTSPGFVNAGTRDYPLASGSAAIDAGVAITGMAYNGAAPDIGAYEFGQAGDSVPPIAPVGLTLQ